MELEKLQRIHPTDNVRRIFAAITSIAVFFTHSGLFEDRRNRIAIANTRNIVLSMHVCNILSIQLIGNFRKFELIARDMRSSVGPRRGAQTD